MSGEGKGRDDYTWEDASRDLALGTRLTLREAATLRFFLEPTETHPYDALPQLFVLFGEQDIAEKARALKALIGREQSP